MQHTRVTNITHPGRTLASYKGSMVVAPNVTFEHLCDASNNSLAQCETKALTDNNFTRPSTLRPSSVCLFCPSVFHGESHSVKSHSLNHCHCWRPPEQQHPPQHHQHLFPADLHSAALAVAALAVVSVDGPPAKPLCISKERKLRKHRGWFMAQQCQWGNSCCLHAEG